MFCSILSFFDLFAGSLDSTQYGIMLSLFISIILSVPQCLRLWKYFFPSARDSTLGTIEPHSMDTRLIRISRFFGQFRLSRRKAHISSIKLTRLLRTLVHTDNFFRVVSDKSRQILTHRQPCFTNSILKEISSKVILVREYRVSRDVRTVSIV